MVYSSCYGSGCSYELPSGECRKHGFVKKCPIDMTQEEWEEEEYWKEQASDYKYRMSKEYYEE